MVMLWQDFGTLKKFGPTSIYIHVELEINARPS